MNPQIFIVCSLMALMLSGAPRPSEQTALSQATSTVSSSFLSTLQIFNPFYWFSSSPSSPSSSSATSQTTINSTTSQMPIGSFRRMDSSADEQQIIPSPPAVETQEIPIKRLNVQPRLPINNNIYNMTNRTGHEPRSHPIANITATLLLPSAPSPRLPHSIADLFTTTPRPGKYLFMSDNNNKNNNNHYNKSNLMNLRKKLRYHEQYNLTTTTTTTSAPSTQVTLSTTTTPTISKDTQQTTTPELDSHRETTTNLGPRSERGPKK